MTTSPQYLLLINIGNTRYIPTGIGSQEAIIDYLAEHTLDILSRSLSRGSIRYEDIWKFYDDNIQTSTINGGNSSYGSSGFRYIIYPMSSIPTL